MKYKYKNIEKDSFQGFMQRCNFEFKDNPNELYKVYKYVCGNLTESDVKKLIDRYNNGESLKQLSIELGVHFKYVQRIFEYHNVHIRTTEERIILHNKNMPKIMLEKYGVENSFQLETVKKKSKETNLKKYGVEHISQSPEIQNKKKETCQKRYGVENPFQSEEVKEKSRQTCLEKYGVEYPAQSKEIKEKTKDTNSKKTKKEKDLKKQKTLNTLHKKYGENIDNPFQLKKTIEISHSKDIIEKQNRTKIDNGYMLDTTKYDKNDYKIYCKNITILTRKVYEEFKDIINSDNIVFKNRLYSIDHKISRFHCFINNVNIYIACHPCNLELLKSSENSIKNNKDSISINSLIKNIKQFNKKHKTSKFVKLFNENVSKEDLLLKRYTKWLLK